MYTVPCRLTLYTNVLLFKSETARCGVYAKKHWESASDEYIQPSSNEPALHALMQFDKRESYFCLPRIPDASFFYLSTKSQKISKAIYSPKIRTKKSLS